MTTQVAAPRSTDTPTPDTIEAYLRHDGWELDRADSAWAVFGKGVADQRVELEVPLRQAARDYGSAVHVLVNDIASLQHRSAAVVLRDIRAVTTDIVRLAITGEATRDGRISVEGGSRAFDAVRDLLLAAACSVLDPRVAYANRKPGKALEFLQHARFGQTEVGSFVVTVETDVDTHQRSYLPDAEPPFSRRVIVRLAEGLAAAERAKAGSSEPIERLSGLGVSANLCEAVADLLEVTATGTVEAGFAFATIWPVQPTLPRRTIFSSDSVAVLRQAATGLRAAAVVYPAAEVVGPVVELSSRDSSQGGQAVLWALVDDRERSVTVTLDAQAYQKAIEAHQLVVPVRYVGDLRRSGQSWVLEGATEPVA